MKRGPVGAAAVRRAYMDGVEHGVKLQFERDERDIKQLLDNNHQTERRLMAEGQLVAILRAEVEDLKERLMGAIIAAGGTLE